MKQFDTPILIVGAGPVGLALAGDLGWRGIPCLVVERSDGSIYQPRQDLVGIRTMEFCRRWGIVGDVEASPYPRDYPQDNIYVAGSLAEGWEIGRYASPSITDSRPPAQSPQRRERCPQNMFDPVLRKFAERHDWVELRYLNSFVGYRQDEDGVTVEIEDVAAEQTYRLRSRWLVGCDGGASAVRGQMGVQMLGKSALTYTTNVIFRCAGFETLHPLRPGYRFIFVGPEGTWATIVAINGRDQWRFSIIRSGEAFGAPDETTVRAAIRRAVGRDFDYEILSVVPWTRRELVAERYSEGNVFIAGDAAHVVSPTGGFGMNTGVGDAVDLSWKLAAQLEGWGGGRLLDSYTVERRPVAERNSKEASGNLARMLSPGHNPKLLERTDEGARLRERVGRDLSQAMLREWNTLGIHLGYVYEGSPIAVPDGSPPPIADHAIYEQTARPGSRAPHVWLADPPSPHGPTPAEGLRPAGGSAQRAARGQAPRSRFGFAQAGGRSTLDLFGRSFVLLVLGAAAPDPQPLISAAERRGMSLEVVRLNDPPVLDTYEQPLILVRPDGHVAWRGNRPPADPMQVVDRVRGAALD